MDKVHKANDTLFIISIVPALFPTYVDIRQVMPRVTERRQRELLEFLLGQMSHQATDRHVASVIYCDTARWSIHGERRKCPALPGYTLNCTQKSAHNVS
jgi:hypothetical protein